MEGGDGTSIRIWTDPWLPSQFLPFVSSPMAQALEEAKVVSLTDPDTKEWLSATIQSTFYPRDAELILSIPLSSIPMVDKLVWPFSQTGVYTIKSRYRFLCRSQSFEDNDYHPIETNLWKKVWGLQVQPKVRNLFWQAIKNSIPSKVNLKRRMVIPEDLCNHCKSSPKDTVHTLWSCPLLQLVLSHDPSWNFRASQPFTTFKDLVEHLIEVGVDLNYFANAVWTIWHRKNALRTSDSPFPILRVLQNARSAQASYVRSIPPEPPDRGSLAP